MEQLAYVSSEKLSVNQVGENRLCLSVPPRARGVARAFARIFSGGVEKALKATWRSGGKAELKHWGGKNKSENCEWSCRCEISGRVLHILLHDILSQNIVR